jgi:hypothetical protein
MLSNHRHLPAKIVLFTGSSLLLLAACQATPEPSDVQTAIAETQIALEGPSHPLKPSDTPTITPTSPTATSTLVPTETITPGPSPTVDPLDLIYTGSPADLQCEKGDLPADYYLFIDQPGNELYGQQSNAQVITDHPDSELAQRYVIETQRTDGWWRTYRLNEERDDVPEQVFCQTTTFASHGGALFSLRWPLWDDILNYRYLDTSQIIGQDHVLTFRQIVVADRQLALYRVVFVYHNLTGTVQTYQPVTSASTDFVYEVARRLLARYQAIPLTDPRIAPTLTITVEAAP